MATEGPSIHDGAQTVSGTDFRNSTYSGSTRLGPSGSGQFAAVRLSTVADRTVLGCTISGQQIYGVLQNKPAVGDAADVLIFGVSKVVCGTTSVVAGLKIMADSSGNMVAYSSAAGVNACGIALETPPSAGAVFTAAIYGFGLGGGSVA